MEIIIKVTFENAVFTIRTTAKKLAETEQELRNNRRVVDWQIISR